MNDDLSEFSPFKRKNQNQVQYRNIQPSILPQMIETKNEISLIDKQKDLDRRKKRFKIQTMVCDDNLKIHNYTMLDTEADEM